MKKYVAIILTALLLVSALAGCSAKKETTDSEKIKAAGKLVVGITDFAPMDYLGDNGEWIGFDADLGQQDAGAERRQHRLHLERHDPHRRREGGHGDQQALLRQRPGGGGPQG